MTEKYTGEPTGAGLWRGLLGDRTRWWLEDGGGLPARRVIYAQRYASVVPMGDPEYSFVSCPYSFPQHCMPYRLSVGAGLFSNLFWISNKRHLFP